MTGDDHATRVAEDNQTAQAGPSIHARVDVLNSHPAGDVPMFGDPFTDWLGTLFQSGYAPVGRGPVKKG